MFFRKILNSTRGLDFRKHRPKFFNRGSKKFFSISVISWKKFPKNASKISFVHVAFDLDNIAKKPSPDSQFCRSMSETTEEIFSEQKFSSNYSYGQVEH